MKPPSFVFALVDTLRRDHVSTYGYDRKTTPFIDSLAAQGLVLEKAIAQAPWTSASMASLWTSRYPSEVGGTVIQDDEGIKHLEKNGVRRLSDARTTLAQALREAGYRTIAIVANPYAGAQVGLLRGFDVRTHKPLEDARQLTDAALALLDTRFDEAPGSPFFLYIHYVDPHEPTLPPDPYRNLFPTLDGAPHKRSHTGWRFRKVADPEAPEVRRFRSHKIALYDGALRFLDDQLRRLSEHLELRQRLSSTVFVIASDHGEEFWDHARFGRAHHQDPRGIAGTGHGQSLFGELTDVPLIFSGPGVPRTRVGALVRNLDVAPTILGLAGIDRPDLEMRGTDLIQALRATPFPVLPALSENISHGPEAKSLQLSHLKLIRYTSTKTRRTEFLFDRSVDPGEQHARPGGSPAADELRGELDSILASLHLELGAGAELDDVTRQHLRALGYAE